MTKMKKLPILINKLLPTKGLFYLLLMVAIFFPANQSAFGVTTTSAWAATKETLTTLIIDDSKAKRHTFKVEVAQTPDQLQRGLMYRMSIAEDYGMIFLYSQERPVKMWMANTYFPLDMLFIDSSGKIVYIVHNTVPLSRTPIGPDVPVRAVLEIRGGMAKQLGLAVGDQVYLPNGGTAFNN